MAICKWTIISKLNYRHEKAFAKKYSWRNFRTPNCSSFYTPSTLHRISLCGNGAHVYNTTYSVDSEIQSYTEYYCHLHTFLFLLPFQKIWSSQKSRDGNKSKKTILINIYQTCTSQALYLNLILPTLLSLFYIWEKLELNWIDEKCR